MLTDVTQVLRLFSTVVVLMFGWMPLDAVTTEIAPMERIVVDTFGPLRIPQHDGNDQLNDGAGDNENLDDLGGGDETLDRPIPDAEPLDKPLADRETLDDGVLKASDPENLDDLAVGDLLDIENLDDGTLSASDPEDLDDLAIGDLLDTETLDDAVIADPRDKMAAVPGPTRRSGESGAARVNGGSGVDRNCADFGSQEEAQTYFDDQGGDARNNVDGLDGDGNRLACDTFAYKAISGGASGGGSAGTSGENRGNRASGGNRGDGSGSDGGSNSSDDGRDGGSGGGDTGGGGNTRGGGGSSDSGSGGGGPAGEGGRSSGASGSSRGNGDGGRAGGSAETPALPNCRVLAGSGTSVAGTGCDATGAPTSSGSTRSTRQRGNTPSEDTAGGDTSGGAEARRVQTPDVRSTTVVDRSADAGTEVEIDRGGDNNGPPVRRHVTRPSGRQGGSPRTEARQSAPDEPTTSSADGTRGRDGNARQAASEPAARGSCDGDALIVDNAAATVTRAGQGVKVDIHVPGLASDSTRAADSSTSSPDNCAPDEQRTRPGRRVDGASATRAEQQTESATSDGGKTKNEDKKDRRNNS